MLSLENFLIFLLIVIPTIAASVPPITSNTSTWGNEFRSGQVTVSIVNGQTNYDFNVPYVSSISSNSIALALSMIDYQQMFDSSNKIFYHLYENTPSASTSSNAVFRVFINYSALTYRARVKYLACPSNILSQNFNIIVSQMTPPTLYYYSNYYYYLNVNLNTDSYYYVVWMSGIEAWKSGQFRIYTTFSPNPNKIQVYTDYYGNIYFGSLRVTLIFINYYASISSNYRLPYSYGTFVNNQQTSLQLYSSWFDTTNIICGLNTILFSASFYDYTIIQSERSAFISSNITSSTWSYTYCFVATSKMCPTTHPYYQKITNSCFDSCISNMTYTYLCCPPGCSKCTSSYTCLNCSTGFYLRDDNLCYSSCLQGTFANSLTNTCDPCFPGCLACSALTVCSRCEQYFFFSPRHSFCFPSNSSAWPLPQQDQQTQDLDPSSPVSQSSSTSSIVIIVIAGFVILTLMIVAILILVIYLWNRKNDEPPHRSIRYQIEQQDPIMVNSTLNIKGQYVPINRDCSICLNSRCSVLTNCQHSFHLTCLASWSQKNTNCPNCREDLSEQMIEMYCRVCKTKKEKVVTLLDLQEMMVNGESQKETLCNACQELPN